LWYMNSVMNMYVICLVVLPIEASFCFPIHNGFYYCFWWLTLVPKVVKLHTEYSACKTVMLSLSIVFLSHVVCLGLGCLVIVCKKTCARLIMGSYMNLIFHTLLYVLL
jgi:threonine/homoserine/homoserine lactone efflux protein